MLNSTREENCGDDGDDESEDGNRQRLIFPMDHLLCYPSLGVLPARERRCLAGIWVTLEL
jgi:hypothetical protein